MTQRQYDAATAQAIIKLAHQEYEDKASAPYIESDDGLYVNEAFRAVCPPGTIFDWTPADDMGWPGSPNPDTAPFLPVPFTASELAACMLDGPGQSIQFALDRRIGYPLDDGALCSIHARHRWMREALHEAYVLAAAAQSVVGEFDHDEEARAHKLAQQYDDANGQANDREGVFESGISPEMARARRERAAASVAHLKAQAKESQEAVTDKWRAWRKAMVLQLLGAGTRQSYLALRFEEVHSDEYKKFEAEYEAALQRVSDAEMALQRREAVLSAPESLGGIRELEAAEAAVRTATRELADARHAISIMRGDFVDSKKTIKSKHEQQAELFWFHSVSLDLEHWVALADVSAREAAMLLSLYNPTKENFEEANAHKRPSLPDGHLARLDRRLTDYAKQNFRQSRSLLDWYSATQDMQIKLESEAISFMEYVAAQSPATPVPMVADSASNARACDFSILATREQLIEAFGRFTGMDASWFKNITDTPVLLAARKVTGQGGRGHIAEPWFCPFEVTQWIADSKRRKGRKVSTEKAWELLQKNFPKVYIVHQIADPRAGN